MNHSRRSFLKTSAALSAAAMFTSLGSNFAHAAGSDRIRLGIIGCGGRGTGAVKNSFEASKNVQLVTMGDLFPDRLAQSREQLNSLGDQYAVKDDHCFTGFDAYQRVLATDVDMVILSTPPAFRPGHLRAAMEAGKHVFAEKPIAVDPTGVRSVLDSAKMADEKKLGLVVGTQRRHCPWYVEVMKRIHNGAIGELVSGNCYWNQGYIWSKPRQPSWSDTEFQLRNWNYYTWLSGDHIVEQHIHQIDVMNWAFGGPPKSAYGMGGRQVRVQPEYGNVFDHFAVEFEYSDGARVTSMCRQIDGTDGRVDEFVIGTKGSSNPKKGRITGEAPFKYSGDTKLAIGLVGEHADLVKSIADGKPLNEGKRIAETTLTAIMARMSAYTGKRVTWEQAMESKLDLFPKDLAMGPRETPKVAMPGKDALI
jgi:myo-inositol 2-dehydrogenase/D-chiro-inositol 1-dehydrogenase